VTRPLILTSEILGATWDPTTLTAEQLQKLGLCVGESLVKGNLLMASTSLGQFWSQLSELQRRRFQSAMDTFLRLNRIKKIDIQSLANKAPQKTHAA
jgi:hypothetical protein